METVEHLIETGRRRIAFVGGPMEMRQVTDRLAGARVAREHRVFGEVVRAQGIRAE